MIETTSQASVPSCPHCGGMKFFRSRKNGLKDWFFHRVLFLNPYRCEACDGRFFLFRFRYQHRNELHRHHV